MQNLAQFQTALLTLFQEAYEGRPEGEDYTWFVEGKEGIFDALENVTADQASRRPSPTGSSIGAHLKHLHFALSGLNAHVRNEPVEGDWESSWSQQKFTEEEWHALKQNLHAEYQTTLAWLQTLPELPGQMEMNGTLAILPHSAFHLGAVRQLMKIV